MDSGWAVVIGAAVALIGSSIVPWARESLQAKRATTKLRRLEVAEALAKVGHALGTVAAAINAGAPTDAKDVTSSWAILLELELLLDKSEKDIALICREAFRSAFLGEGKPSLAAYAEAVAAWHRDGISPADALTLFHLRLNPPPPSS